MAMTASGRPMNYTTTIPVAQTAGECQAILGAAGASSVAIHFEDGRPAGLSFSLKTPHGVRSFTLPVNVTGAQAVLARMLRENPPHLSRSQLNKLGGREHAANVAWRVVKDWLEANLALIAAQMATIDEVMLPYLHVDGERTLWQAYRDREDAALMPGSDDA
jgi:hypothetical protein